MEMRFQKLETDVEIQKKEMYTKLADFIAQRVGSNVEKFFPRFVELSQDFDQHKQHVAVQLQNFNNAVQNESLVNSQIDSLKKDLEYVKKYSSIHNNNQMENMQETVRTVLAEFESIKHKIKYIPSIDKLELLERRVRECVSFEQFTQYQQNMRMYATGEEMKRLMGAIAKIDSKLDMYLSKDDYQEKLLYHNEEIQLKLEQKVSIRDFNDSVKTLDDTLNERLGEVSKTLGAHHKNFLKIATQFTELKSDMKYLDEQLATKVDTDEGIKIWQNFNKYALYEDLKGLYQKTIPSIQRFEEKVVDYYNELEKQKIIMRRFDEVMTEKASKTNIDEVYDYLHKFTGKADFIMLKDEMSSKLETNKTKQEGLEEMIDLLGKNITKDIYQAVRKATQHLTKNADSNADQSVMNDEMKGLIQNKVDRSELMEFTSQKSNKVDTEMLMRWIEVVHKQLKQATVLISEILKFDLKKNLVGNQDGSHCSQNAKTFLYQQSLLICQWMNKFDAKNINEYFDKEYNNLPPEIAAFQHYTEDKLKDLDSCALSPSNPLMNHSIRLKSKSILNSSKSNNFSAQPSSPNVFIVNNKVTYGVTPSNGKMNATFNFGPKEGSLDQSEMNNTSRYLQAASMAKKKLSYQDNIGLKNKVRFNSVKHHPHFNDDSDPSQVQAYTMRSGSNVSDYNTKQPSFYKQMESPREICEIISDFPTVVGESRSHNFNINLPGIYNK